MSTPSETERVELMLCVLPWIASRDGATLEEIGEHFGADPEQVSADLDRVFYDVEIGDPSTMVSVFTDDDGNVSVDLPGSFEEPPDLDHSEALHLLASGEAMAGVHGAADAIEPALDKLADVLGPGARTAIRVELGSGDPAVLDLLRSAARERRSVRIVYFSWGSDRVGERVVDPWATRSVRGEWYLTGHCHDRDAMRHFRLDRILAAEAAGDAHAFDTPGDVPLPDEGFAAEARQVELHIDHSAAWVVDSFPVQAWDDSGDQLVVRLGVSSESWLDRLLLRLPDGSTAVDSANGEDLMARRAEVAARVLERHGVDKTDGPRR
ncbi:MAG: WYL domain-containing protein [Actinomycetia bacterium]|nr:WYL domain-containing protein [Actinomycetes bacterium]